MRKEDFKFFRVGRQDIDNIIGQDEEFEDVIGIVDDIAYDFVTEIEERENTISELTDRINELQDALKDANREIDDLKYELSHQEN